MLPIPWGVSPDALDYLDADIVRFISGVMTDDFTDRMLGRDNFKLRRRVAELMAKHSSVQTNELGAMPPERRRALAETIIRAEIAESDPRSLEISQVSVPTECEPKSAAPAEPSPESGDVARPQAAKNGTGGGREPWRLATTRTWLLTTACSPRHQCRMLASRPDTTTTDLRGSPRRERWPLARRCRSCLIV